MDDNSCEMEEHLCDVEIVKQNNEFIVRIQSEGSGMRDFRSNDFEEVLEQLYLDLREESESFYE